MRKLIQWFADWLSRYFGELTAEATREDQLRKAQLSYLEHQAAAEHHQALADMYNARITRLETVDAEPKHMGPIQTVPAARVALY